MGQMALLVKSQNGRQSSLPPWREQNEGLDCIHRVICHSSKRHKRIDILCVRSQHTPDMKNHGRLEDKIEQRWLILTEAPSSRMIWAKGETYCAWDHSIPRTLRIVASNSYPPNLTSQRLDHRVDFLADRPSFLGRPFPTVGSVK